MIYKIEDINKLSGSSGVYIFRNKKKEILYIGRATLLRDRVKSYFNTDIEKTRSRVIKKAIDSVVYVETIETDSVLDSILLEAKLIRKHEPLYNSKEKDTKSFNYIVITDEEYPRILIKREREIDEKTYKHVIGPFVSYVHLDEILKYIRKIIPFRDKCRINQKTECLYSQINLCPGVCVGNISKLKYQRNIEYIHLFLACEKIELINKLTKERDVHVKKKNYEAAEEIQNKINSLKYVNDMLFIKEDSKVKDAVLIEGYDVSHFYHKNRIGVIVIYTQNELKRKRFKYFRLDEKVGSDIKNLSILLKNRFEDSFALMPDLIVIDGGKPQFNGCKKTLEELNIEIPMVSVLKDERHKAKKILGDRKIIKKYEKEILLVNEEAHIYSINVMRRKIKGLYFI